MLNCNSFNRGCAVFIREYFRLVWHDVTTVDWYVAYLEKIMDWLALITLIILFLATFVVFPEGEEG